MSALDELDLALLDGMHVNPRASFDELGRVLGISGPTVARRWRRLVDSGKAWVSSAIGPSLPVVGGLLEAECAPSSAPAVAARLASVAQVFSTHITTGRYNVYALVVAADERAIARLLVDALPSVAGVRAVRTASVFQLFSGTHWRLGAITSAQAREVSPPTLPVGNRIFDDLDRQLYLALQEDGRLSYRELAAELGVSELVTRRRVQLLVRSQALSFRTDFARAAGGWPTNVVLLLRVGVGATITEVGRTLVDWPETRVCAAVLGGGAHLFVTVQVHHLSALDGFIARLRKAFEGVEVLSSRVVLRPVKSYGRLLDVDGYANGMVPVNPWADVPEVD